jgi:hypothetical protein
MRVVEALPEPPQPVRPLGGETFNRRIPEIATKARLTCLNPSIVAGSILSRNRPSFTSARRGPGIFLLDYPSP